MMKNIFNQVENFFPLKLSFHGNVIWGEGKSLISLVEIFFTKLSNYEQLQSPVKKYFNRYFWHFCNREFPVISLRCFQLRSSKSTECEHLHQEREFVYHIKSLKTTNIIIQLRLFALRKYFLTESQKESRRGLFRQ